jgi:Tol biopolymer transport system component
MKSMRKSQGTRGVLIPTLSISTKVVLEMTRKYRLAIMDQDGANHQFLSSGNSIVHTPRFSPDRTKIAYLDFGRNNKEPNLQLFDLQTGQSSSLGAIQGLVDSSFLQ